VVAVGVVVGVAAGVTVGVGVGEAAGAHEGNNRANTIKQLSTSQAIPLVIFPHLISSLYINPSPSIFFGYSFAQLQRH
jgi:hypothetical protein